MPPVSTLPGEPSAAGSKSFASIPHRNRVLVYLGEGHTVEARKHVHTPALLLIAALVLSAVLIGVGIYRATDKGDWVILSAGALGVVLTISIWALAVALTPHPTDRTNIDAKLDLVAERLRQATELLSRIGDQQLLSDRAKAVAFREKDRDALRRAILEEINRGDWDASLRLADEMEASFGYRAEASRFRDEVRARRQEQARRQVQEVVEVIDRHTRSEQWN